eukprot:Rmarinus@m.25395
MPRWMHFVFVAVLVAQVTSLPLSIKNPIKQISDAVKSHSDSCGSNNALDIGGIEILPEKPKAGDHIYLTIDGVSDEHLGGSSRAEIDVIFGGYLTMHTEKLKLCDHVACPVEADDSFEFKYDVEIPPVAPPGSYTVKLKFSNDAGKEVACIERSFKL